MTGTMTVTRTALTEAAQQMGLRSEASIWGRWIRFPTDRGTVYIAAAAFGRGYYMWCEAPGLRAPRLYRDARDAIEAGLTCGVNATIPPVRVTVAREPGCQHAPQAHPRVDALTRPVGGRATSTTAAHPGYSSSASQYVRRDHMPHLAASGAA